MCVQDWNIPQSFESRFYSGSSAGVELVLELEPDKSRVGIWLFGPSAGTLDIRVVENSDQWKIDEVAKGQPSGEKRWFLRDVGPLVQDRWFINTDGIANWAALTYHWVLNPAERERLANTGGF